MVPKQKQIIRDYHYVPQWYQRGFLAKGRHKLFVLNLHPAAMLAYIDEIVIPHPFVNANGVGSEFNPVRRPEIFREQTLREVYMLMILEPWIAAGRVHLIPDPLDYDSGFQRTELRASS